MKHGAYTSDVSCYAGCESSQNIYRGASGQELFQKSILPSLLKSGSKSVSWFPLYYAASVSNYWLNAAKRLAIALPKLSSCLNLIDQRGV